MTRHPLRFLALLESSALLFGFVMSLAAWWWTLRSEVALAALLGSLFSSGNLRLLIWNWSPMLDAAPPAQVAKETHSQSPPTQNADDSAHNVGASNQDTESSAQIVDASNQDTESSAQIVNASNQDVESSAQIVNASNQDAEPSAQIVGISNPQADNAVPQKVHSFAPVQRSLLLTGRFLFKHLFLLGGLILCLWGLKLHVAGFSLGLGNIVIAILFSPLLPQSTE
ncbi:hypothetical protein L6R29_07320 [Myxococcota bacterium]|nr:hypothetical protein [Myxococcota bacterium]